MTVYTSSGFDRWLKRQEGQNVGHRPEVLGDAHSDCLVHRKHVDRINLEDRTQRRVTHDDAFILGLLQAVTLDVFPQVLDGLWAGELVHLQQSRKRFAASRRCKDGVDVSVEE